jgi:hypothetical protein
MFYMLFVGQTFTLCLRNLFFVLDVLRRKDPFKQILNGS